MNTSANAHKTIKHFLQISDFSKEEIQYVLTRAQLIKDKFKRYEPHHSLHDRTLAMVFEKPAPAPGCRLRRACINSAAVLFT